MMWSRIGRPPTSTSGLGRNSVSSRRRVPWPPHRITTFTPPSSRCPCRRCSAAPVAQSVSPPQRNEPFTLDAEAHQTVDNRLGALERRHNQHVERDQPVL